MTENSAKTPADGGGKPTDSGIVLIMNLSNTGEAHELLRSFPWAKPA